MLRNCLLALLVCAAAAAPAQTADSLAARAQSPYATGAYAESVRLFAVALDAGARDAGLAYNAACAFALAGEPDAAFHHLRLASDLGFVNAEHVQRDLDPAALHSDERWAKSSHCTSVVPLRPPGSGGAPP